jgi:hypothetical protein
LRKRRSGLGPTIPQARRRQPFPNTRKNGHAIGKCPQQTHASRGCRLEPLSAKASQTAFHFVAEGDGCRAIKLEIKLDHVAHMFPMSTALGSTP